MDLLAQPTDLLRHLRGVDERLDALVPGSTIAYHRSGCGRYAVLESGKLTALRIQLCISVPDPCLQAVEFMSGIEGGQECRLKIGGTHRSVTAAGRPDPIPVSGSTELPQPLFAPRLIAREIRRDTIFRTCGAVLADTAP